MKVSELLLVGRKIQLQAPIPLQRTAKLALLPMAQTGSGGPSPRPPLSERQDTWGVMASYVRDTYRRGGVG